MGEGQVKSVSVSAPGKVLLAGGYLILRRPRRGLVVAVSARFHSSVTQLSPEEFPDADIVLQCPQFGQELRYSFGSAPDLLSPRGRHPYFEEVVHTALTLAPKPPGRFLVTLKADNEFYSQQDREDQLSDLGLPRCSASLRQLTPFEPCRGDLSELRKTGLGSSAALVTSLLAAMLLFVGYIETDEKEAAVPKRRLDELHALAQYAHCLAQGKVGSGFDVSSAVYGSQEFCRASASVLAPHLDASMTTEQLVALASPAGGWDNLRLPFHLPRGLRLVMGDVNAGSSTPSMVRTVLKWKAEKKGEADALWRELAEQNNQVTWSLSALSALQQQQPEVYERGLAALAKLPATEWAAVEDARQVTFLLQSAHDAFVQVRRLMKRMGDEAGVPIEPQEQTDLLDATMAMPGVVFAGVPGAGGNDAVFAVLIADSETCDVQVAVEEAWTKWAALTVLPTPVCEGKGGVVVEDLVRAV